jgi:energy-converting hydrogenase A subunit M
MNTNYKRYLFKIVAFITILAFTPLQILSSSVFANTRIENKKQSCVIDTGKPEKFVTGFIPSNFTFTDLPFSSKSHLRIEQPDQSLIGSEIKRILGNKGDGYTLQHSGLKLPPKVKEAIMEQLATMEDETPQQRAKAVLESEVMRKATGDTVNWLNNLLMSIYNGERINLEKEGIAGDMAEVIEAVQKKPARSNIKASEPKTNGSNFIMDIPDEELIKQLRVELNIRQRKYIERLIKIFDILWDEDRAKTKKSDFYKKLFHKFIITQTLGTDYGTFYMGKPGPKPSNAPVNILKDKGISIPPELDLLLHGTTLKNVGEVFTKISESKLSAPEQKWLKQGYLYFYIASRIEHNADYLKKKTAGAKVETRPQPFQSFRDSLSLLSKNKIKPELYLPVSKLNAMLVNGMSYGYSQIIAIATEASQPVDLPRSEREARIMEIESDLKEKYSDEKEIAHRLQEIAADLDVTKDEMIKLFNIGFSMSGYDGLLSIFEGRIKFPFNSLEDKITTGALKAVIDKRKKPDYLWYAAIKDTISNLDRFN